MDTPWRNLINWSLKEFSHLPWRRNRGLYRTLISEVMLQQTTVSSVIPKFEHFTHLYPSWKSLQDATINDILSLWAGLGYYQRARRLKQLIDLTSEGNFVLNLESSKWPGVGPYTKNALLAIGLDKKFFAVDANIKRVLDRLNIVIDSPRANELLNQYSPRCLNEAMMDLGRVYCKALKPKCVECPLASICPSAGQVTYVANKTPQIKADLVRFIILSSDKSQLIGTFKSRDQWLSGFIEPPTFSIEEKSPRLTREYPVVGDYIEEFINLQMPAYTTQSTITKYKFSNKFFYISEANFKQLLKKCKIENNYEFYDLSSAWCSLLRKNNVRKLLVT